MRKLVLLSALFFSFFSVAYADLSDICARDETLKEYLDAHMCMLGKYPMACDHVRLMRSGGIGGAVGFVAAEMTVSHARDLHYRKLAQERAELSKKVNDELRRISKERDALQEKRQELMRDQNYMKSTDAQSQVRNLESKLKSLSEVESVVKLRDELYQRNHGRAKALQGRIDQLTIDMQRLSSEGKKMAAFEREVLQKEQAAVKAEMKAQFEKFAVADDAAKGLREKLGETRESLTRQLAETKKRAASDKARIAEVDKKLRANTVEIQRVEKTTEETIKKTGEFEEAALKRSNKFGHYMNVVRFGGGVLGAGSGPVIGWAVREYMYWSCDTRHSVPEEEKEYMQSFIEFYIAKGCQPEIKEHMLQKLVKKTVPERKEFFRKCESCCRFMLQSQNALELKIHDATPGIQSVTCTRDANKNLSSMQATLKIDGQTYVHRYEAKPGYASDKPRFEITTSINPTSDKPASDNRLVYEVADNGSLQPPSNRSDSAMLAAALDKLGQRKAINSTTTVRESKLQMPSLATKAQDNLDHLTYVVARHMQSTNLTFKGVRECCEKGVCSDTTVTTTEAKKPEPAKR